MSALKEIVGDVNAFLDNIFSSLEKNGIDVSEYFMDHLCFRVATIEEYEKKGLIKQIRQNAEYLKNRLSELNNFKIISKIKNKGLLCGVELEVDKKPLYYINNEPLSYFLMKESIKKGVFLRTLGNVITLIPPLAIPIRELTKLIETQSDIIKSIEKSIL